MPYNQEFKEIGRVQTSDSKSAVLSELLQKGKVKGVFISNYINSQGYVGFEKGGVKLPADCITEFLKLFGADTLKEALEELEELDASERETK